MFQRRWLLPSALSLLAALLVLPIVQAGSPRDSLTNGQPKRIKPTRPPREDSRASRTPLWRLRPSLPAPRMAEDPNARTVDVAREAALTARGSGDLDPTIDVQITQEIIDKAAELGSVQAMYEFVRNECAFQPYYGSQKGSVETLRQRAGNDYDLASLLIALLRASGIPARYAVGMVEMPTARVNSWLAVEHGQVAGSILFTNGMEGVSIISGPNVVAVRCRRVWVEALVPRGFGSATWTPLDPAFHLTNVSAGMDIPEEMGLDAVAFVDEYYNPTDPGVTLPRTESLLEVLKDDISAYLDVNHPGTTLNDVMRSHEIVAEELGILPGSLPYTVRSRDLVFSEIPANRRYQIRFEMLDASLNTLINYTADLPTMAGKRVTIDYVGATQADVDIIEANGGIYQTPPSSVDLKPVLRIDGQQVAVGAAGVGMGMYHYSDMYFLAPVNAQGLPQNVVPAIYNVNICGASQAIAVGIEGSADRLLIPPPADDTEGTLSLNYDTGVDYLANVRNDELELAALMHAFVTTDVTTAILHNVVKVTYSFGVPQTFDWVGLLVDADRAIAGYWPVDRFDPPGAEPKDFLVIGGANGSAWENFIFERSFSQDSVSTMKILQFAIDNGVTVYQRWNTLPLPANTQPTSVRNALTNAINNGHEVTFPAAPMTIGDVGTGQWTGTGWIDMDPDDGAAGYIISGNNNGGATFEFWPPEFIDLGEGDRDVTNVVIRITEPDMDSPDSDSIFTRDAEQKLTFKYELDVTYSDATTATLGPYTKTTQNTTKTFSPGNYTFHVWVARFAWFSFGIWDAERKVSIVGVLIRKDDGSAQGQAPPKFIEVAPPAPKPKPSMNVKALVIPEKAPDGTTMLANTYSWTTNSTPKITFTPTDQQATKIEPASPDPSPSKENEEVSVLVTLIHGKQQKGYAKFKFAQGGEDEKHKMTVAKVLLKELTYDGSSKFAVRQDNNSGNYDAPHWKDNSSPLNGDASDSGDRKYPVIFKKNTKMKVKPIKFEVAPADAFQGTLKVTGDGPGNLDFPEKTGTLSGSELTIAEVECSNAFVDAVDFFPESDVFYLPGAGSATTSDGFLKIAWKVQPEGESECCKTMQPSSNQVYVTWKDPLPTPPSTTVFHTVAHKSCKNADGENDKNPITTKVWGEFTDRDVRRVDGTRLTYYASFLTANLNTQSLLAAGDGQCGSWASLFLDMLRVQGIDNTNEYVLFRSTIGDGFLVKKWTLIAPGTSGFAGFPQLSIPVTPLAGWVTATAYNWRFTEATDDAGDDGQGTTNPASKFNNHQVVFIDGTYYDPSYGKTYTGANIAAAGIDDAAISAHYRQGGGWPVNEPAVGLDLSTPPNGNMTDLGVPTFVMVSQVNPAGNNLVESKGDYPFP